MREVSIVGPDDGEIIALGPARMRVLEDGTTTSHRLGVTESILAPHTPGPPQHRHLRHDEGFYIVSGTALFTVGETDHQAPPGTLVMVPPGAPHTFANPGDEPVVMITTFTPDLYLQYFRDVSEAIADGATMAEATGRTISRYATELATDYAQDDQS